MDYFSYSVIPNFWASCILLMWLTVLSLLLHNLHLLFFSILLIFALIWLVLMGLFSAAIKSDSVSFLLLQAMQQWFSLSRHISKKHQMICIACIRNRFYGISLASFLLFVWTHFLSLGWLIFVIRNLNRLWIEMVPIHLVERLQWQCQSSQCHSQVSE